MSNNHFQQTTAGAKVSPLLTKHWKIYNPHLTNGCSTFRQDVPLDHISDSQSGSQATYTQPPKYEPLNDDLIAVESYKKQSQTSQEKRQLNLSIFEHKIAVENESQSKKLPRRPITQLSQKKIIRSTSRQKKRQEQAMLLEDNFSSKEIKKEKKNQFQYLLKLKEAIKESRSLTRQGDPKKLSASRIEKDIINQSEKRKKEFFKMYRDSFQTSPSPHQLFVPQSQPHVPPQFLAKIQSQIRRRIPETDGNRPPRIQPAGRQIQNRFLTHKPKLKQAEGVLPSAGQFSHSTLQTHSSQQQLSSHPSTHVFAPINPTMLPSSLALKLPLNLQQPNKKPQLVPIIPLGSLQQQERCVSLPLLEPVESAEDQPSSSARRTEGPLKTLSRARSSIMTRMKEDSSNLEDFMYPELTTKYALLEKRPQLTTQPTQRRQSEKTVPLTSRKKMTKANLLDEPGGKVLQISIPQLESEVESSLQNKESKTASRQNTQLLLSAQSFASYPKFQTTRMLPIKSTGKQTPNGISSQEQSDQVSRLKEQQNMIDKKLQKISHIISGRHASTPPEVKVEVQVKKKAPKPVFSKKQATMGINTEGDDLDDVQMYTTYVQSSQVRKRTKSPMKTRKIQVTIQSPKRGTESKSDTGCLESCASKSSRNIFLPVSSPKQKRLKSSRLNQQAVDRKLEGKKPSENRHLSMILDKVANQNVSPWNEKEHQNSTRNRSVKSKSSVIPLHPREILELENDLGMGLKELAGEDEEDFDPLLAPKLSTIKVSPGASKKNKTQPVKNLSLVPLAVRNVQPSLPIQLIHNKLKRLLTFKLNPNRRALSQPRKQETTPGNPPVHQQVRLKYRHLGNEPPSSTFYKTVHDDRPQQIRPCLTAARIPLKKGKT